CAAPRAFASPRRLWRSQGALANDAALSLFQSRPELALDPLTTAVEIGDHAPGPGVVIWRKHSDAAFGRAKRRRIVTDTVLVMHRELANRFDLAGLGRLFPERDRGRPVPGSLRAPGQAQESGSPQGPRIQGQDPPILFLASLVEPGPLQHSGQAENVPGVVGSRFVPPLAGQDRESREGEDVLAVVVEDPSQGACVAATDPVEVDAGNLLAGNVTEAAKAEQLDLEVLQPAGIQTELPQPTSGVKQVEVREGGQGGTRAVQAEAGVQQRDVEHLAVEGDEVPEAGKVLGQRLQRRRLLVVVPHEVLADDEAAALDEADTDQERRRARAAGEARGFGVEKDRLPEVEAFELRLAGQDGNGRGVERVDAGQGHVA